MCFCKQKTAYEMRISDWSSDVCSSDLLGQKGIRIGWGYYFRVGITLTTPILLVTLAALALTLSLECAPISFLRSPLSARSPLALPFGRGGGPTTRPCGSCRAPAPASRVARSCLHL